uniref:PIH1 domain-containing protein 2 n=1 Tax=Canis lupus familiaris TaxID=9615 RepID=A0A8C0Q6L3_CANLF
MPRSRSSGTAPGPGRRSPEGLGTLRTGTPLAWAPTNTRSARRGEGRGRGGRGGEGRLPSGRQKIRRRLCHRDPCPPAATELGVTFPPNALPVQTHTNTPIPCAAASRGGDWGGAIGLGDKGAGFPSRPEVVLRRNASHPLETQGHPPPPHPPPPPPPGRVSSRLSRWKGAEAREAGAFLEKKWVGLSGKASPTPEGEDPGTGRENTVLPGAFRTQLEVVPGPVTVVTGVAVCQGTEGRALSFHRLKRPIFRSTMESSSKGRLTQVTQLWNLLDDLAESDPESYKKFIQQQLKEGKELCAAPEPQLCLQSRILKPKEKVLFINLCQWKRIPAPQSATHPVLISVGKPEDMSETSDVYTVISVAYNPDVLQAAEKDQVKKDQLIRMAMKCIEEKFQFTLSHSYSITKFRIKGSIERMKQNLMGMQAHPTDLREKMRKELTFEEISSTLSNPDHFQLLLPKGEVSSKKRCLIEEISSTEIQVEMKEPTYELKIVADQKEKPQKIEIKVELPGINSVSLCDLSVSEDDLLIEVSEKYRLHLNLPESVNTEMTTAKFIKEKATLIITMPLV